MTLGRKVAVRAGHLRKCASKRRSGLHRLYTPASPSRVLTWVSSTLLLARLLA
jgi:hypothetical protein